tara:strand:+ start:155 stop:667 length:513 start_codon:yes stop_codon:yes gene_type:complete
MSSEIDNLFEVVRGGTIKRYHTLETIGEQSVGAHSWGVALILQYLKPSVSKVALLKALTHDIAELYTGDIPAPVKWDNPKLVNTLKQIEATYESKLKIDYGHTLKPEELVLFKQADMFELLFFCMRQRKMGNTNMNTVFSNGVEYLANQNLNERGSALLGKLIESYGGAE